MTVIAVLQPSCCVTLLYSKESFTCHLTNLDVCYIGCEGQAATTHSPKQPLAGRVLDNRRGAAQDTTDGIDNRRGAAQDTTDGIDNRRGAAQTQQTG